MTPDRRHVRPTLLLLLAFLAGGCGKRAAPTPTPSSASAPAAASATAARPGEVDYSVVATGSATFLIDAPLEKIRGGADRMRGSLRLDPHHLGGARGEVAVDLTTLVTHTFGDPAKDARQTDHARNWLELGGDVPEPTRDANRWVSFALRSLRATPDDLATAPSVAGRRRVELLAEGDVQLHGVTVHRSVRLAASFAGDAAAPSELVVTTLEPLRLSLREHDVRPRDVAGTILKGALERAGDKLVDEVQISLELTARRQDP